VVNPANVGRSRHKRHLVLRQEAAPLNAQREKPRSSMLSATTSTSWCSGKLPFPEPMATSGFSCYGGKAAHLGAQDAGTAAFGALGVPFGALGNQTDGEDDDQCG
jgi:hypothetical protein